MSLARHRMVLRRWLWPLWVVRGAGSSLLWSSMAIGPSFADNAAGSGSDRFPAADYRFHVSSRS